jgi:ribosomal protein L21E
MLLLGMTFSIEHLYRISSNIEAGHGRPDIRMESKIKDNPHIIVEFKKYKEGENIENLKDEALQQIIDNQYYRGLTGEILCLGIAHDIKRCSVSYKIIDSNS